MRVSKRRASGGQAYRRPNGGGRGWSGGPSTPVAYTPRATPRTPVKSVARNLLGAGVRRLAATNPYTRTAMAAYDTAKFAQTMFRRPAASKGRRTGSAANSKSAGYFGKASSKVNAVDKHLTTGSVYRIETGYVWTDAVNQVSWVAQTTAPANQIGRAAFAALVKKLYKMQSITIRSHDSLILEGNSYDNQIILDYKDRDGGAILQHSIAIPKATSTLNSVAESLFTFANNFRTSTSGVPDQFLKIQLYDGFNSVIITKFVVASLQLTQCKFKYDCLSHLKIQNRTINTAGNNEADDIDNVPIDGRFFDYKSNGTTFNDYTTAGGSSVLTTNADTGVLPISAPTTTGTTMYKEIPNYKQFSGCKQAGNCHLDPGEIKTSVLKDSFTLSFSQMMKILFEKPTAVNLHSQYLVGKSRAFAFEKMINAVAMSGVNQFVLAVEHQFHVGCTISVKRDFMTAAFAANALI